jgi:tetratricopeptide (TPR) repeat protein
VQSRSTGSRKYVGKAHLLRGEIAMHAGQWHEAIGELREALALAEEMRHPTLGWQSAHRLAEALAFAGRDEHAVSIAQRGRELVDRVAAMLPDDGMRRTFLAWPRVESAQEAFTRLSR